MVGPPQNEIARVVTESGAGFVIPNGQPRQLADAIRRLRSEPRLAASMGRAARSYYEMQLGRDRSVRRIIEALTQAPIPSSP